MNGAEAKAAFEEMFTPKDKSAGLTLLVLPEDGAAAMSDERLVMLAAMIGRCLDAALVYCLLLKCSIVVGGGGGEDNDDHTRGHRHRDFEAVGVFPVVLTEPTSPLVATANEVISAQLKEGPRNSDKPSLAAFNLNTIADAYANPSNQDGPESSELPTNVHRIMLFTPQGLEGRWEWRAFYLDAKMMENYAYCYCAGL
jgi:hypothetical protein